MFSFCVEVGSVYEVDKTLALTLTIPVLAWQRTFPF